MSNFRYVPKKTDTKTKPLDRKQFWAIANDPRVKETCINARKANEAGDDTVYDMHKSKLPLAFWCGFNTKGVRTADALTPTQFFIIDIDHANRPARAIWQQFLADQRTAYVEDHPDEAQQSDEVCLRYWGVMLAHETPSGGLRMVLKATRQYQTIAEHQTWLNEQFSLSQYGDFDKVVKDLSRGSFMVMAEWIIYEDAQLWVDVDTAFPITADAQAPLAATASADPKDVPVPTDAEKNHMYEGKRVAEIAEAYIKDKGGVPTTGLRHAFYNALVKNFRNICESDPRIVFACLPLCEGTPQKRWSQCTSICRSNNTSKIPKDFYFWLLNHGYTTTRKDVKMKEYLESDVNEEKPALPVLPPVFREFCAICPPDFVYPIIVGLMPVMGTLTSFVRSEYIDLSEQSTTFFACIWAPPSGGKSFAKKLVDILMKKIKIRDEINDIREQLWLVDSRTKADDEKGKDLPHVMVRIMPAINSLPEFLEKMRDNKGYHMFTLAEEVDTFKKGSSSGGADKSDLFRTAWDNSEYGQSFKSTGTFKGKVAVYYNILLTGTPGAVKKYYSNVEDGMVTRISICEIENQQFAKFQPWKPLNQKQREVIEKFIERCDANTYQTPLEMDVDEARMYDNSSTNYDQNVKWKFGLKEKTKIDMSWLFPTILNWLEKTRLEASMANDVAKDTFRKRCAVKGFRLGMVCWCCWPKVNKREMEIIRNFVTWFMDRDLAESMKMFGEKYNKLQEESVNETAHHQSLFDALGDEFTRKDVIDQCIKLNIRSKVKVIIHRWKQDGVINKVDQDKYKKVKKII